MKKLILLSLIMVLCVTLLNADAVAMLMASKGKLSLSRAASQIKFHKGELLMNNDVLRTGAESFAAYKYVDASSTVKMFSNSVATITATKEGIKLNKNVAVSKGSILTNVNKGTGLFRVSTPTTVASVKGTEFFTKVEEGGATQFLVTDGEVEVRILVTDETAVVGKGQTALISALGELHLRASNPDDLSAAEQIELESMRETVPKVIRIPVLDENGRVKYIEITY